MSEDLGEVNLTDVRNLNPAADSAADIASASAAAEASPTRWCLALEKTVL
jgi:hypothetical protein